MSAGAFEYEPIFYSTNFDEFKNWFIEGWSIPVEDCNQWENTQDINDYFQDNDYEDKVIEVQHISTKL